LSLTANSSSGFAGWPNSRKNGIPIPRERFQIFLQLSLKFLSDPDGYSTLLDYFIKDFYVLTNEEEEIENLIFITD